MKLKERKNTTLVLLVVCQFTDCYKKSPLLMHVGEKYLEDGLPGHVLLG